MLVLWVDVIIILRIGPRHEWRMLAAANELCWVIAKARARGSIAFDHRHAVRRCFGRCKLVKLSFRSRRP